MTFDIDDVALELRLVDRRWRCPVYLALKVVSPSTVVTIPALLGQHLLRSIPRM